MQFSSSRYIFDHQRFWLHAENNASAFLARQSASVIVEELPASELLILSLWKGRRVHVYRKSESQHQNYQHSHCGRATSIRIASTVIVERHPTSKLVSQPLLWKRRAARIRIDFTVIVEVQMSATASYSIIWFCRSPVGVPCALLKGLKEKMHTWRIALNLFAIIFVKSVNYFCQFCHFQLTLLLDLKHILWVYKFHPLFKLSNIFRPIETIEPK